MNCAYSETIPLFCAEKKLLCVKTTLKASQTFFNFANSCKNNVSETTLKSSRPVGVTRVNGHSSNDFVTNKSQVALTSSSLISTMESVGYNGEVSVESASENSKTTHCDLKEKEESAESNLQKDEVLYSSLNRNINTHIAKNKELEILNAQDCNGKNENGDIKENSCSVNAALIVKKANYSTSETDSSSEKQESTSSEDSITSSSCEESSRESKESSLAQRLNEHLSSECNEEQNKKGKESILHNEDSSKQNGDTPKMDLDLDVTLTPTVKYQSTSENSKENSEQNASNSQSVPSDVCAVFTGETSNPKEADKIITETPDPNIFPILSELSKEEIGFPSSFDGLVSIGKYIPVKGDFTLRSSEALIESPSLVVPFLLKEPDKFPSKEKEDGEINKPEPKGFFRSSVGEFLISLGLSRVSEWFHRDMTRIKTRQMKREGKTARLEQELEQYQNSYLQAKRANEPFSFPFKSCETCNFTTESSIVMEGHLLVPHITSRREYRCSFCTYVSRDPREMLFHMEAIHSKIGRIQPPVLFYECPYCSFESNSKVKLNTHLNKCQKYFDRAANQAPPKDFDLPTVTPKPITVAVVKAYEKSISCMHRGRGRPKKIDSVPDSFHHHLNQQLSGGLNNRPIAPNQGMSLYRPLSNLPLADSLGIQNQVVPSVQMSASAGVRPTHSNVLGQIRPGPPPLHLPTTNRFFQVVNSSGQVLPVLGNNQLVSSPSQFSFMPNPMNSGQKKMHSPHTMTFYTNLYGSGIRHQMSMRGSSDHPLSIAQPPKLQGPYPVQLSKTSTSPNTPLQSSSLVVCEICDGYIKDLEQLRTHMQLIHKVKIHPKMLVSRPPLNCQKCQWRFFTDQGLERHLLGAHGLVTSNMQELANKNKDAGCCTICGRVYASKLVAHMNQVHKVTLKPAHLSYKCTVCSATFNLYRLFENHVYLVHSGAAKRPSDSNISAPSKKLAKLSNSEKSESDTGNPSKSPSEKENDAAQKKLSVDYEDNEDHCHKRCKSCGTEIKDISHDKKRHTKQCDMKRQNDKCEKCLNTDGIVVIRTDVNPEESGEIEDESGEIEDGGQKETDDSEDCLMNK